MFFTYSVERKGDIAMDDITKRFTEGARRLITLALLSAKDLGHSYVGSEHLLLGLLRNENSVCAKIFIEQGIDYHSAKSRVINMVGMGCKTILTTEDMTPICRRIILRATIIANTKKTSLVSESHLAVSMLAEECVAVRIITELGGDADEIQSEIAELFFESGDKNDIPPKKYLEQSVAVKPKKPTPLLDANAIDLTEKARGGKVDPVIGREKEEERMISVLLRRSKNNPCLVGEAGVGKTAVVESLASRIVSGKVPDELKDKRIMSLELSMVVAGTKYRGEFEEKIKNIIEEVKNAGDVILFVDEIHTNVGAGGAEGAIDASNILKPALARGEIRLIGATTIKEFRESIEKDKALERRFQSVVINEPKQDECLAISLTAAEDDTKYHKVIITDEAVREAVRLSTRYIYDRFLPDKAIDLIDEASASLKMSNKDNSIPAVTQKEIAYAVERKTGIPVSKINCGEKERVDNLRKLLKSKIIGQDQAIDAVCNAYARSRLGLCSSGRPMATFLFLGKSGVGKTETAKAVAKGVFDRENAFIKLDMSEFSESHSVSKLIGSPAGYIGFGEGGNLTDKIKRKPYSLVLFDEIEKAHPDVRNLLLQILDEGKLTDSSGESVSFENTVVIMTANCEKKTSVGFGEKESKGDISKVFSAEIVDRVDEVIWFKSLDREELAKVAQIRVDEFSTRMEGMGISVEFSEDFCIGVVGIADSQSARTVSRVALKLAEEAISGLILEGEHKKDDIAMIFLENQRGIAKIKQKIS